MEMKISVNVELTDFKEIYGDDSLDTIIKEEIKFEVLKRVKESPEYIAIVKEREIFMMDNLEKLK